MRTNLREVNALQQATLEKKIRSLEKAMRDFIRIDGISIQSISEHFAELKEDDSDFKASMTSTSSASDHSSRRRSSN
jgi:low affinity Fe/Cu permease